MKKVSYWAKGHVLPSRIIIVVAYLILSFTGIFIGKLFTGFNLIIPGIILNITLVVSGSLFFFYPAKRKDNYFQRKSFDFALLFATFFMMVFAGNHNKILSASEHVFASSIVLPKDSSNSLNNNPHITSFIDLLHHTDISKLTVHDKRQILKHQIKEITKDKELTKSQKLGLIILSIIVALLLMMGIAALSCNLACAGSGAAATILWLGGWFFIIFFLARTINYISNGPRKRKRQRRMDAMKNVSPPPVK